MGEAHTFSYPRVSRPQHDTSMELKRPVALIINLRETAVELSDARTHGGPSKNLERDHGTIPPAIHRNGLVHRLTNASRSLQREKRRSICGWRAGGVVSNARFCETTVWPPPGMARRLCNKCFPEPVAREPGVDVDPIEVEE